MSTIEEEKEFCELRDKIRDRLNYLKTTLPEANGRTDEIRREICSLEERLSREYNDFIKGSGVLSLAMKEVEKFIFRNRLSNNLELKDYDSLFSNALNVLFRCVRKYNYEETRFSTFFTLAIKRDFLNVVRESFKRKRYSLQEEDYFSTIEDKSCVNPSFDLQREEELERLNKGLRVLTEKEKEFIFRRFYLKDSEYCKPRHSTGQNALAKLKAYFESFDNRSAA